MLNSAYNLKFLDLYQNDGLKRIDEHFLQFLSKKQPDLAQNLQNLRQNPDFLEKKAKTEFLIETAKILEEFLAEFFQISAQNEELQQKHHDLAIIYEVKRDFVQRFIAKKYSANDIKNINKEQIFAEIGIKLTEIKLSSESRCNEIELKLAQNINLLTKKAEISAIEQQKLDLLTSYAIWALFSADGQEFHKKGSLFNLPKKTDFEQLFPFITEEKDDLKIHKCTETKSRQGFNLTDSGANLNQTLGQANYCIFCHNQQKDSCSTGLKEKNSENFKENELGVELAGCPLEQKISEMNLLKSQGFSLAALAIVVIDNPLTAGTGHRICNDCMKSCIYQKQDAVDIPQVETRILKDVLNLPFGFEIYSLLTRWNPLNLETFLPQENSGKKILIAGLGPAGYTLAHYLLNSGHFVVGIDGLKIEPLDPEISGIDAFGNHHEFKPIKDIAEIYEELESRPIYGFGGVAEYGITSRWDKNFLKIIRLLLERRQNFRMFGGLRFGSSITEAEAFEDYNFDHIALCIGAGQPTIIDLKNNYAKGIRAASDFLMALQLQGAYKKELLANLQIRMPIIVVGGGLTATDTATESLAYYLVQIEKFAQRFTILSEKFGTKTIFEKLTDEEKIIAKEFLQHAFELENARKNGDDINELVKKWGGVKILYRKQIKDSPAYRLNDKELQNAFFEGVEMIVNSTPQEAILDEFNHLKELKILNHNQREIKLSCKTLLIAAGTTPNISIIKEDNLPLNLDGKYFAMVDENGKKMTSDHHVKSDEISIFTKISNNNSISFLGDLHPNFEGNVVKAMASAKRGYKQINEILTKKKTIIFNEFLTKINEEFLVTIKTINKLSDHVFEIIIKAPLLAKKTQIGQIFRLQNYQYFAKKIADQILLMEGISVTALKIDKEKSLITGIVVNTGGSTSLIANFKENEPAIFMGPSGKPTQIAKNQTVMLVGGGRGNMPLTALAAEFRKNNCRVIFFAGYKESEFIVRQEEMEDCANLLIYAVENKPNLTLQKPQNIQFHGSVIDAIIDYAKKPNQPINLSEVDTIMTIGNNKLMAKLAQIRHQELKDVLKPSHIGISSLNAPMQCMLKGVCSQCLQKRINEKTGLEEYFYACADQDQNMDLLNFEHLHSRCEQNSLSEKMTKMWISSLK